MSDKTRGNGDFFLQRHFLTWTNETSRQFWMEIKYNHGSSQIEIGFLHLR